MSKHYNSVKQANFVLILDIDVNKRKKTVSFALLIIKNGNCS